METLPSEMISEISKYLDRRDLLNCLAVSHQWRVMFDIDEVWRRHCDQELADYLSTTPSLVEPVSSNLESGHSVLPPISKYRLALMRENQLWKNWEYGNYKSYSCIDENFVFDNNLTTYRVVQNRFNNYIYSNSLWKFVNNDFIIEFSDCFVELWDLRQISPISVTRLSLEKILRSSFNYYSVNSDLSVIVRKTTVLVVEINLTDGSLTPKHLFRFDQPKEATKIQCSCLGGDVDCSHSTVNFLNIGPCVEVVSLLIGNLLYPDNTGQFHVWDLKTGQKLREEPYPVKLTKCLDLVPSSTSEYILAVFNENYSETTKNYLYFFVYSLRELAFLSYCDKYDNRLQEFHAISGNLVAISIDYRIRIKNFETSECLFDVPLMTSRTPISAVGGSFLFKYKRTLSYFHPPSRAIKKMCDEIYTFTVVSEKLVLVARETTYKHEFWKIDRSSVKKIAVSVLDPEMVVNKACTRVVQLHDITGNKVKAFLHFW